ncbi:unnamed protein product, partial [Acidithrix sp. C25]
VEFIPAIDLLGGESVRLYKGDYNMAKVYDSPLDQVRNFIDCGVSWIHIVDLDAARQSGNNQELIGTLVAISNDAGVKIEVGGGIRSMDDAQRLVESGVSRLIIGTKAVSDPELFGELCSNFSGAIAAGLDYRNEDGQKVCALNGWLERSDVTLEVALARTIELGASALVLTDISRDGTLEGPDFETLFDAGKVAADADVDLIASGGVSGFSDLVKMVDRDSDSKVIFGVISGKAVHEGLIDVMEAVKLCKAYG